MNFGQLQARVKAYLIDVPAATDAEVPAFLNAALRTAQDRHNFRFMEAEASFVTVEGERVLGALPDDWKEHRALPYLLGVSGSTAEVEWAASRSEMVRLFGESVTLDAGAPKFVLETATQLHIYPFPDGRSLHPDGEYRIFVPYWSRLPDMTAGVDSNWFTDNAADYLTFFATAEGMVINREEERASVYVTKAENEFQRLVRRDKRSRLDNRFTLGFHHGVHATRFQRRRTG
jgi:hypothetical protein